MLFNVFYLLIINMEKLNIFKNSLILFLKKLYLFCVFLYFSILALLRSQELLNLIKYYNLPLIIVCFLNVKISFIFLILSIIGLIYFFRIKFNEKNVFYAELRESLENGDIDNILTNTSVLNILFAYILNEFYILKILKNFRFKDNLTVEDIIGVSIIKMDNFIDKQLPDRFLNSDLSNFTSKHTLTNLEIELNNPYYKYCNYSDFLRQLNNYHYKKDYMNIDGNEFIFFYNLYKKLFNGFMKEMMSFGDRLIDFQLNPLIFYYIYINKCSNDLILINKDIFYKLLIERLQFLKEWFNLIWFFEVYFNVAGDDYDKIHSYYLTINIESKLEKEEINHFLLNERMIKNYGKTNFIKRIEKFLNLADKYRESFNYYYYYNSLNNLHVKINSGQFETEFKNINLNKEMYNGLFEYIQDWRIEWEINNKYLFLNDNYLYKVNLIWQRDHRLFLGGTDLKSIEKKIIIKNNINVINLSCGKQLLFKDKNYVSSNEWFLDNINEYYYYLNIIKQNKFYYLICKINDNLFNIFIWSVTETMTTIELPWYFENLNLIDLKNLLEIDLYSKTYNCWGDITKRNLIYSNLSQKILNKELIKVFRFSVKDGNKTILLPKEMFTGLYDFYFKIFIKNGVNLDNKKDLSFKFNDDYFDFKIEDVSKSDNDCIYFESFIHKQSEKKIYSEKIINNKIEIKYFWYKVIDLNKDIEEQISFINEIFVYNVIDYNNDIQILLSIPFIFYCDLYEYFYFINFEKHNSDVKIEFIIEKYNEELLKNNFNLIAYNEDIKEFKEYGNFSKFSIIDFNDHDKYDQIFKNFDLEIINIKLILDRIKKMKKNDKLNLSEFKEKFNEIIQEKI